MGGPSKRRVDVDKTSSSSGGSSSHATDLSEPKSIARFDGNQDPVKKNHVVDYARPNDLKNISEALGYAGWCHARGVSTNDLFPRVST